MSNGKMIREAGKLGWIVLKINNYWRVDTNGYYYLTSKRGLIQDIKREKKTRKWMASPEGIRFTSEIERLRGSHV